MESGTDTFGRSLPWFELLGMGFHFITAAKNLGFHSRMNLLRAGDLIFVLVKPVGKPAAFLSRKLQQRLLDLFYAHVGNLRF